MTIPSQRYTALDVFRGMTICFMIIVNTPGNGSTSYSLLQHARWNGFTPTDLVFPSFMFAVGNALSFVMRKWESLPATTVVYKILKRTCIIFLLGFLMYWFPFVKLDKLNHVIAFPISETRIFGVLQRIGLAYGISALLLYFLKPRLTIIITAIILVAYWFILLGFGDASAPLSLWGNAVLKLDTWLIGTKHIYLGEGVPFDPEGFLSTFPSVGNVVGGFVVGSFIQQKGKTYEGITRLLLAGFALIAAAYFWDTLFPINKKLWTSPFVLHTVGLDCVILSAVIYVIDFRQKTKWTGFFEVLGKNPLPIYLLSEILVIVLYMIQVQPKVSLYKWIYDTIFSHATPYLGSLLFAIAYMLLCWSVGYWMDKKKIYIRV